MEFIATRILGRDGLPWENLLIRAKLKGEETWEISSSEKNKAGSPRLELGAFATMVTSEEPPTTAAKGLLGTTNVVAVDFPTLISIVESKIKTLKGGA